MAPTSFVFPNDVHPAWSIMIVLYPFMTGLVLGNFVVSALYFGFRRRVFEPVARLALVTSLCFCACATLPLLLHLRHPERAFNVMITPNATSAMAMFGFAYSAFMVLLLVEVWLVFRPAIVSRSHSGQGWAARCCRVLSFGTRQISPGAQAADAWMIRALAVAGVPLACLLSGYVGFLFCAIKGNPWWSTTLLPFIFLISALASGIAALLTLYLLVGWWHSARPHEGCLRALCRGLWIVLASAVVAGNRRAGPCHLGQWGGGEDRPNVDPRAAGRVAGRGAIAVRLGFAPRSVAAGLLVEHIGAADGAAGRPGGPVGGDAGARDALERRGRRAVVLQKFSRIRRVRRGLAGPRRARRRGDRARLAAGRSVDRGQDSAAVAKSRKMSGNGPRHSLRTRRQQLSHQDRPDREESRRQPDHQHHAEHRRGGQPGNGRGTAGQMGPHGDQGRQSTQRQARDQEQRVLAKDHRGQAAATESRRLASRPIRRAARTRCAIRRRPIPSVPSTSPSPPKA